MASKPSQADLELSAVPSINAKITIAGVMIALFSLLMMFG
jgi:hypothetical protein